MVLTGRQAEPGQDYESRTHVLVVDDDRRIRQLVSRYLSENGFVVSTAEHAAAARRLMETLAFDILIVDVMMPGETGLAFTKVLRETKDIPVLMLTALAESGDRIAGLETGADDYLPKPFEPRELILRINAILRRRPQARKAARRLRIGERVFDSATGDLSGPDGASIRLTDVEANLLRALGSRPGEVVSRDELSRLCETEGGDRTVDVQVTRLRRKLEENTRVPRYLLTLRGKGYMLRAEEL